MPIPQANRQSVRSHGMEFFDLFDDEYDALKDGMGDEGKWNFINNSADSHLAFLKEWAPAARRWAGQLKWPKGSVHLDVGSGCGVMGYLIAGQGYHSIAVELEATNLAGGVCLAEALAGRADRSLQLWVANIYDLPLPDRSVDFVTIKEVLHHLPETDALFAELWRVLRPGGRIYCSEPFWPSHALGPVRWAVIEKWIRPRELAKGIRHVYYSFGDYRRMFARNFAGSEIELEFKNTKLKHRLTQNRFVSGYFRSTLTPKPAGAPRGRTDARPRRPIDPPDFLSDEHLQAALENGAAYKGYLDSL